IITCRASGAGEADALTKELRFDARGRVRVTYRWEAATFPPAALFATEISLARPLQLTYAPTAEVWSFPVVTVAKSERGLEETTQGYSFTPRWPVSAGGAQIELAG
ncbi:MAG: alpha-amylase/4-alpha-glucanotransferase domain-containing protein, partial [Gemmatimonadales bacterium]